MNDALKLIAEKCMNAAYSGTMSFPEIIGTLIQNGFESYHVDYLRGTTTYYQTEGGNIELPLLHHEGLVASTFNTTSIQAAIKEAQLQIEGYSYKGFCEKIMKAGCAGYIVSFLGKRVVYFGRTADMHVEHFPQ